MSVAMTQGRPILKAMIQAIRENRDYLSELDGKIGDGDHGINMAKGFELCDARLGDQAIGVSEGFLKLSDVLMTEIGGSMGPIYGVFFEAFGETAAEKEVLDADLFSQMLQNGIDAILEIGGAERGDKTLLDTLFPAQEAYERTLKSGETFRASLVAMKSGAQSGCESTRDMQARIGRASRLGERSIGVLDAGASSCALLLSALSKALIEHDVE